MWEPRCLTTLWASTACYRVALPYLTTELESAIFELSHADRQTDRKMDIVQDVFLQIFATKATAPVTLSASSEGRFICFPCPLLSWGLHVICKSIIVHYSVVPPCPAYLSSGIRSTSGVLINAVQSTRDYTNTDVQHNSLGQKERKSVQQCTNSKNWSCQEVSGITSSWTVLWGRLPLHQCIEGVSSYKGGM
jgi:hypothetical protein